MCRHVAVSPVRYLRYLHHYASGVPRSACMPLQSVDSIAYDSRAGFALGWDLGCHLECLVAHGSRGLDAADGAIIVLAAGGCQGADRTAKMVDHSRSSRQL
jgi:hypothetical protein